MDWTEDQYRMTCGSAEAESRKYRRIEGSRGCVWLVAIQPNAGDNVYFHDPKDTKSDGFAGRTLQFPLEDGTVYSAKGPWHTNCDALFKDTGVDIRNQHQTFVVLAKERDYKNMRSIMKDVVYMDDAPVIGDFDRWKELAKQHPEAVYYYSKSSGGSSCGMIRRREDEEVE